MNPSAASLSIGCGIKDYPPGYETEMKQAHGKAVATAKALFTAQESAYHSDLKIAEQKKERAELAITTARLDIKTAEHDINSLASKRVVYITTTAVTGLAAVALLITAVVTGILFIACAAVPLAVLAGVNIYYLASNGRAIEAQEEIKKKLEAKIEKLKVIQQAPETLVKPALSLPKYNPSSDLELKESREKMQLLFVNKRLSEIIRAEPSYDTIIKYDLLAKITGTMQPTEFYSRFEKLAEEMRVINKKESDACSEYATKTRESINNHNKKTLEAIQNHSAAIQRALAEHRPFPQPTVVNSDAVRTEINKTYAAACEEATRLRNHLDSQFELLKQSGA